MGCPGNNSLVHQRPCSHPSRPLACHRGQLTCQLTPALARPHGLGLALPTSWAEASSETLQTSVSGPYTSSRTTGILKAGFPQFTSAERWTRPHWSLEPLGPKAKTIRLGFMQHLGGWEELASRCSRTRPCPTGWSPIPGPLQPHSLAYPGSPANTLRRLTPALITCVNTQYWNS